MTLVAGSVRQLTAPLQSIFATRSRQPADSRIAAFLSGRRGRYRRRIPPVGGSPSGYWWRSVRRRFRMPPGRASRERPSWPRTQRPIQQGGDLAIRRCRWFRRRSPTSAVGLLKTIQRPASWRGCIRRASEPWRLRPETGGDADSRRADAQRAPHSAFHDPAFLALRFCSTQSCGHPSMVDCGLSARQRSGTVLLCCSGF